MKNKREKIILIIASVFLTSGIFIYKARDNIMTYLGNNPHLMQAYKHNQGIRVTKEIFRKVHDEKLRDIIKKMPLEKQEIVNEILFDSIVTNALNMKNSSSIKGPEQIDDLSYEKALNLITLSKGLNELSLLSPELKNYLDDKFPNLYYQNVATKGKELPELVRAKEKLLKLTSNPELKTIVKKFSLEKVEALNQLMAGDEDTTYFLENFQIKDTQGNISLETFSQNMNFPTMKRVYSLAQKLTSIKEIDPLLKNFIETNTKDFDYESIHRYGTLYLSDIKNSQNIDEEYLERLYTFEKPYIKLNPYDRTPLAGLIRFEGDYRDTYVSITVVGEKNPTPLTYVVPNTNNELPLVGLYPREENTVTLKLLDKDKKVIKKTLFKVATPALSDKLPVVIIEKKFAYFMEPGMNLVSYNAGKESMPFIFDSNGNIRYILSTSPAMGNIVLERDKNGNWIGYGNERSFTIDLLGKILDTRTIAKNPFEIQKLQNGVILSNTQYLMKKNNYLTVFGYSDKSYPSALFQEIGCDSKEELFRARIYYDGNSFADNNIMRGERIALLPDFAPRENDNGTK